MYDIKLVICVYKRLWYISRFQTGVVKESYRMKRSGYGETADSQKVIEMASAIGDVFGPIGTVLGGFVGGILCIFICAHGTTIDHILFLMIIKLFELV